MKVYPTLYTYQESSDGLYPLKIYIRLKNRKYYITPYRIKKSHWTGKKVNSNNIRYKQINTYLEDIVSDIIKIVHDKKITSASEVLGVLNNRTSNSESFMNYGLEYIKRYDNILTYKAMHGRIIRINSFKDGFYFSDIDNKFLNELVVYLKKGNNDNTVRKTLKSLHQIIKDALDNELIDKDPMLKFKMPPAPDVERTFLSFEELNKFASSKFRLKWHNLARDIFLFQVFCDGIRISNALLMRHENIVEYAKGQYQFEFFEKKNTRMKKKKYVYISNFLRDIINKYKGSDFIFPLLPSYYFKLSDKKKENQINKRTFQINSALDQICKEIGINKKIRTHSARHTATYLATEMNMPIGKIRDMLGHKTISTTNTYINKLQTANNKDHQEMLIKKLQDNL